MESTPNKRISPERVEELAGVADQVAELFKSHNVTIREGLALLKAMIASTEANLVKSAMKEMLGVDVEVGFVPASNIVNGEQQPPPSDTKYIS